MQFARMTIKFYTCLQRGCFMFEELDKRVKKLDALDMALVKWAAFVAAVIIIKLIPQLLNISYLLLLIILIALAARPAYKFWS
jgi:hypothetical protein